MARLLIHVEGQTEETFVNEVLAPHLYQFGYTKVSARLLGNARLRSRRGGICSWAAVRNDLLNHLREDAGTLSTIMVDYYALPKGAGNGWPMRAESEALPFPHKSLVVQNAILTEVCQNMGPDFISDRFIPYIMMYEFEGLLFSSPTGLANIIGHHLTEDFETIKAGFDSPEHINDSPETAPSKRILKLAPNYVKPLMGTLAVMEIGLDVIRAECSLFDSWVNQLENGCLAIG